MYDHFKDKPLEFCPGCRSDNQCGDCGIRDCARDNKLDYFSLCDDFPCHKLIDFNNDGKPHHAESLGNLNLLTNIGEENWLDLQKEKWTCIKCNARYSWYFRECECIDIEEKGKKQIQGGTGNATCQG